MKELVQVYVGEIRFLSSEQGDCLYLAGVDDPGDKYFVIPVGRLEAYDLLAKLHLNRRYQFSLERLLLTAIETSGIWIEHIRLESRTDQECFGVIDLGSESGRQAVECQPLVAIVLGFFGRFPILVEQAFVGRIPDEVDQGPVPNPLGADRADFSTDGLMEWLRNVRPKDFGE